MSNKIIDCRWGILGCGPEAAIFVAELQAANVASNGEVISARQSSDVQVRHIIVAVSSSSISTSRAFADSHIHFSSSATTSTNDITKAAASQSTQSSTTASSSSSSSSSHHVETFGTSTELHAHPCIDSIFVASSQQTRYHEALSALRGGKSVLVSKPLAMSYLEGKELCDLASRQDREMNKDKVTWLGFLMGAKSAKKGLLAAADECAKGRANEQEQSPLFPWSETLAVLEALDEIRESRAIHLSCEDEDTPSAFPKMMISDISSNYSSSMDSPVEQRRRRLSVEVSKRPTSRGSYSSDVTPDDRSSTPMLRSQLHELKHILRQKNALISNMEAKDSTRAKISGRNSLPVQAKDVQTLSSSLKKAASLEFGSHSFSSTDDEVHLSPSSFHTPLSKVGGAMENSRRKRREANGSGRRSVTPDRSNSLGLSTVQESNSNTNLAGEGFLAPTIASESRRIATAGGFHTPKAVTPNGLAGNGTNGLGSPVLGGPVSPGGSGKGSSKVINSLTNDLTYSRSALDDTKIQLRTSQKSISVLQKSLDETKEVLGRSRVENERLAQMMARKERQIQEALERARKAEVESKELGKSSREWGARVRKVEAELGEERILKQRAEVQYEAISTNWKTIREAWEKEMIELRQTQGEVVKQNRDQVAAILAKSKAAEESWRGREEEGKIMHGIVKELESERNRATVFVQGPVKELVNLLREHENHTTSQEAAVKAVEDELKRILRLMRSVQGSS
ncbi:hypothetical protein CBS101457_005786 [Exobasidium rhododendri]|nr:hypothetical protein CBS101457_005786 [Exobasidium rhododendri]